jgi:hypothetical protein
MDAVVPLVAVSGVECVEALTMAGFAVIARTDLRTTLVRGDQVVMVPDVPFVAPEDLTEILATAGIAYPDFLDLLSEAPTDPAISRTRVAPSVVHR